MKIKTLNGNVNIIGKKCLKFSQSVYNNPKILYNYGAKKERLK